MSALATPPASSITDADGSSRQTVPATVWWGSLALAAAAVVWATRRVAWFEDDFVFLGEARSAGLVDGVLADRRFDWDYLSWGLFEHFSPVTRMLFYVCGHVGDPRTTSRVLMIGFVVGCVYGFASLTRALLGRTAPALLLALIASQCLVVTRLATWTTAGFNILPATALSAFSLAFAVRHVGDGRRRTAVGAVMCFGLAALDYELAMLVPGFAGLWYLASGRWNASPNDGRPWWRRLVDGLRARWWLWGGYGVVLLAALANYRANYYLDTIERAGPGTTVRSLGYSLLQGLFPSIIGVYRPATGDFGWSTWLAAVFWATVVVIAVRAGGRRALAMIGVGVVAWMIPTAAVAVNRAAVNGVGISIELYYASISLVGVVLAAAAALAATRAEQSERTPLVATLVAVLTVSAVMLQLHAPRLTSASGRSTAAAAVTDVALDGLAGIGGDERPAVVDLPLGGIVGAQFFPYDWSQSNIGLFTDDVRWNVVDDPLYRLGDGGTPVPVELVAVAALPGLDEAARIGMAAPDGAGCITFGDSAGRIELGGPPTSAGRLAVRLTGEVSQSTAARMWGLDNAGQLRYFGGSYLDIEAGPFDVVLATDATELTGISIDGFRPGTTLCLNAAEFVDVVDR